MPAQDQRDAHDDSVEPPVQSRLGELLSMSFTVGASKYSRKRPDISDDVKDGMKGAVKVAILALGMAAQATQNVPYLGAISKALTAFKDALDVRR